MINSLFIKGMSEKWKLMDMFFIIQKLDMFLIFGVLIKVMIS